MAKQQDDGSKPEKTGFWQEWRAKEERKRQQRLSQPDPWFTRKSATFIAIAVMAYATYCFLARVCVPMLKRDGNAGGSFTQGVLYTVFFCLLFLMMAWSYAILLTTGPGYVKDFVEQTPSPDPPTEEEMTEASNMPGVPATIPLARAEAERQQHEQAIDNHQMAGALGPAIANAAVALDTSTPTRSSAPSSHHQQQPNGSSAGLNARTKEEAISNWDLPQRKPSPIPVLLPYYRWCTRCERVKPYRAHHCRHCGTCVLKMDHHCPWVGSCVGAKNYRYFLLFLAWCGLWILYLFICTLLCVVPVNRPAYANDNLDPQHVVLLGLSGFFGLFVLGMLGSHIRLLLDNHTTIEDIGMNRTKDEERELLSHTHGMFNLIAHHKTRTRWVEEWGHLAKEGNPWWLGSRSRNVAMVFGKRKLAWFLPIPGMGGEDGLSYELNPRFTPGGIWQPRWLWPEQLRHT